MDSELEAHVLKLNIKQEPKDIDETVYHEVNFVQTKYRGPTDGSSGRKFKRYVRKSRLGKDSSGDESHNESEVEGYLQERKIRKRKLKRKRQVI